MKAAGARTKIPWEDMTLEEEEEEAFRRGWPGARLQRALKEAAGEGRGR